MIIWKGKETRETVADVPSMGLRAWRWVFVVKGPVKYRSVTWLAYAGFEQQLRYSDVDWHEGNHVYSVSLTNRWRVGQDHSYYDGPNCSLSLGFLRLDWRGMNCKKCWGDT